MYFVEKDEHKLPCNSEDRRKERGPKGQWFTTAIGCAPDMSSLYRSVKRKASFERKWQKVCHNSCKGHNKHIEAFVSEALILDLFKRTISSKTFASIEVDGD